MSAFLTGPCGCPGCGSDACTPPAAPASTLVIRISSASKTKCGFDEYVPSSPPKVYRTRTLSGSITYHQYDGTGGCIVPCARTFRWDYSGNCTFDADTCAETDTGNLALYGNETNCSEDFIENQATCEVSAPLAYLLDGGESTTATTRTLSATNHCVENAGTPTTFERSNGSVTETLTNEYTTAMLESAVDAALPAFSGAFAAGTPIASYDLSTDEKTSSKSKAEYKYTLPDLTGFTCYKLTWVERFTPEGGGAPTDTAKSYLWNGSDAETPVYTLNVPGTQGTTTIISIVASCSCS